MTNPHGSVEFEYPEEKLSPEIESIVAERVKDRLEDSQRHVALNTITRVLVEILSHADPGLTAAAIAYAGGLPILEGKSEVDLAKRFGVTKQAFSRRVTEISKQFGLTPSRGMRSETARETFEKKQLCRPKSKLQLAMQSLKFGSFTRS